MGTAKGDQMKVVATALIVLGVAGLAYGGFTYTRDSSTATVGPIEFTVKDQRTVGVPVWAGVGAIVIGAALLAIPLKKG
jgi:hypothetical protein